MGISPARVEVCQHCSLNAWLGSQPGHQGRRRDAWVAGAGHSSLHLNQHRGVGESGDAWLTIWCQAVKEVCGMPVLLALWLQQVQCTGIWGSGQMPLH